jgi:hypothetical protein
MYRSKITPKKFYRIKTKTHYLSLNPIKLFWCNFTSMPQSKLSGFTTKIGANYNKVLCICI